MRPNLPVAAALLACLMISPPVVAQDGDYTPFYFFPDHPRAMLLNGEIDFRTPLAFKRAMKAHPSVQTLVLNSPGGSVQAALIVAEEIFDRGMTTLVAEESECASACAYIFFGGRTRLSFGKLGVHQISGGLDIEAAQTNLSDVVETLSRFGVSNAVLTKMLRTPPNNIYYFTPQELGSLGINREITDGETIPDAREEYPDNGVELGGRRIPIPLAKPSQGLQSPAESAARGVVVGFFQSPMSTVDTISRTVRSHYDKTVVINGTEMSQQNLINSLAAHSKEWPQRRLDLDFGSLKADCRTGRCIVVGRYNYSQSNGVDRTINSVVSFEIIVDPSSLLIHSYREYGQHAR